MEAMEKEADPVSEALITDRLWSVRSTKGDSSTTASGRRAPWSRSAWSAASSTAAPADSARATTRSFGRSRRSHCHAARMSSIAAGQGCSGASR